MDIKQLRKRLKSKNYFAHIAFWQLLGFVIMLCLIWVNEILDLSFLFFGIESSPMDINRGMALSIAVIACSIITIGHTYVQQKRIIKGLLTVCSCCHKIKIDQGVWEELEEYVTDHSLAAFSHGLCPDCYKKMDFK